MASITAPLHSVPTATSSSPSASTTAAARTALPAYVAPAVAGAIGAFTAVIATWGIVATQTLHMSL